MRDPQGGLYSSKRKAGMVTQAKEIGSEFWDAPVIEKENGLFPKGTQWYLSGRSALQAIIRELKDCSSVAVPSWCCDSMIKPFSDAGFRIDFYPVYWENGIVQEPSMESDVLFLMDYFGYTPEPARTEGYEGIIIRDVTHSLFSASYSDADYYFGSLRKWCGVWTGGFAWASDGSRLDVEDPDEQYISLRKLAMEDKRDYIYGTSAGGKGYLDIFGKAEQMLETAGIEGASDRDISIASHLDVSLLVNKRRSNAKVLMEALGEWLIFPTLRKQDCPMFVPVLVPGGKRDLLRAYLIRHNIYCPVHWPLSSFHNTEYIDHLIYDNELSLVCDQRYGENDMKYIVDTIHSFYKETR